MIVCPNCTHQNPDGAVQCEACYTPLPALATCPSCGASVQSDASFCGQCGFDLRATNASSTEMNAENSAASIPTSSPDTGVELEEVEIPDLISPDPLVVSEEAGNSEAGVSLSGVSAPSSETEAATPVPPAISAVSSEMMAPIPPDLGTTQLQVNQSKLLHIQTDTLIELPPHLNILHIGKPNDRIPPTIDVSGFPNSEIVSRVHANIRVEGDIYYIEDVGSSNGTYVNNMPLSPGNRHRLRAGDRVALGKGDKVTFVFQSA